MAGITLEQAPVAARQAATTSVAVAFPVAPAVDVLGAAFVFTNRDVPDTPAGWTHKLDFLAGGQGISFYLGALAAGWSGSTWGGLDSSGAIEAHVYPLLGAKPLGDALDAAATDDLAGANANNGTLVATPSEAAPAIVLAAFGMNGSPGGTQTVDGGFTAVQSAAGGACMFTAYKLTTTAEAHAVLAEWPTSRYRHGGIVVVQAAPDPAPVVGPSLQLLALNADGAVTTELLTL